MPPTEATFALYRAAAQACRHTRRVLKGKPHDCLWAAAGAAKVLRPDLDDAETNRIAAEAVRWVGENYPKWFWR